MFKSKTVFIIGAGASAEVNMPVGASLKEDIKNRLDFSELKPGEDKSKGDRFILDALQKQVSSEDMNHGTLNDYQNAARIIKEGMSTDSSIDTLIDTYKENEKIAICGKLAIIRSILNAESRSMLFHDTISLKLAFPNFRHIENTWYMRFFRILIK